MQQGQNEESWDDPQLQSAIGKFVIQFSQLEYIVRHLLGAMKDLHEPQFDIITGSFDFARLCEVTEAYLLSLPDCSGKLFEHTKKTFAKRSMTTELAVETIDDKVMREFHCCT
jgi:hypothetical protein